MSYTEHSTDTAPPEASTLPDRVQQVEDTINRFLPMLEELATVADKANQQNHSLTSIFGAIGQQLLGIVLHKT